MDTKLKKYDRRRIAWLVSTLLFIASATAAVILGMNLFAMYTIKGDGTGTVSGTTTNAVCFTMFGMAALAVAALVVSVMKCGIKQEDGRVRLTWFDKIFPEVQIIVGVCVGAAMLGALYLQCFMIVGSSWFVKAVGVSRGNLETFLNSRGYLFYYSQDAVNILGWPILAFLAVLMTAAIFACELLFVQSIAKMLKDRCFWSSTIIGKICCYVSKKAKGSDNIFAKVMIVLIVGALIGMTWVGAGVAIVLIIIFVPKWLAKYQAIKDGVSEIKGGSLDYKIPVDGDGELERLAANINDIGESQSIAIQNELKNQRLKTDLISNVSHDLKTPLTSMVSYVDLLKKEGLDSENAPEYLRIIDEKTSRLQKLTEDLFEAAKASSGDIPVNMERIEMISIANQALAELEENLAQNNIDVVFTPKLESAYVMADGQLLWRVIENLLTNVSKYALPGSRAYVDISQQADKIRLEVKNMSRDQLNISADELMERFKRGDESRNTEGSGLGLAIARDLTNLMNGSFDILIDGDLFKATVELNIA